MNGCRRRLRSRAIGRQPEAAKQRKADVGFSMATPVGRVQGQDKFTGTPVQVRTLAVLYPNACMSDCRGYGHRVDG